jgi:hypothetical protein
MKEAASPPLSFSFAAQATGPLLRPQGWLRIALRATNAASLALCVSRQLVWVTFGFRVLRCPVKTAELL